MTEKPHTTEARLLELYSAPNPNPEFARRLRAELINRHPAAARRARWAGFWHTLHAAGRWSLGVAGAALLIGLIAVGALLLPGQPAGGEMSSPATGSEMSSPATETSTPAVSGMPLPAQTVSATGTVNAADAPTITSTPLATTTALAPATAKASATAWAPATAWATATSTPLNIQPYEAPALSPRACQRRVTPAPSNANYNRPGTLLGGGLARSGDYQINLYLFCDDAYGPNTTDGSHYSDIQGLGLYVSTWYGGQAKEGLTSDVGGVEPNLQSLGGTSIERGGGVMMKQGLRVNPGQLLDWSGAVFHLRYVYKIHHPDGAVSGAALAFTLAREADGFLVRDARIEPLSAEELAKPLTFSSAQPPVPARPDAPISITATPIQPTVDPHTLYPLTLAQAEQQAGFALLLPDTLPDGLTLIGANYDAQAKMVEYSYAIKNSGPGVEGLVVREQAAQEWPAAREWAAAQPLPAGADCELCGFLQGSGKEVDQYPPGKLVSEDTRIETVAIGEGTGQYVEGVWTSWTECCGWRWDPIPYMKRLRFWKDGLAVEIWAGSNRLTQADLIALAESLQ